jgi:hypothetical protein
MNCLFCQKELKDSGQRAKANLHYRCHPCHTDYHCDFPHKLGWLEFTHYHNRNMYRILVRYDPAPYFHMAVTYNYDEDDQVSDYQNDNPEIKIFDWDYVPDITPQNIAKKLPTLLTFS